jgi:hypothetical protein
MIPADAWNSIVAEVGRNQPLQGCGVDLRGTPEGAVVSASGGAPWDHPWRMRAEWADGEWRIFVTPGFINGRDAVVPMERDGKQIEAALTDEAPPHLVVSQWRDPIRAGEFGGGYPAMFKKLGVRKPPPPPGTIAAEDEPDPTRNRELRACDVALVVPRMGTATQLEDDTQFIQAVTFSVNPYGSTVGNPYRLTALPWWTRRGEPSLVDRLLGTAEESQTDEIKVGTLWILSPPDVPEDAVPDATWTAYPQHHLFWNLAHRTRNPVPRRRSEPLVLVTGLPLLDLIGNQILIPLNAAWAQIENAFSRSRYDGEFWTV